ncbi:MAG: class I SAM-dependent rRNA methyltransferase [Saccharofermentanales bacterium]
MAIVHVINGRQKKLSEGHPWVYRNEIEKIEGDTQTGDIVEVMDFRGRFLGRGFINPLSLITVRLLTHKNEEITDDLIIQRVRNAVAYRRIFRREDTDCERAIFGEADLLPGVIADKFGDVIVLQTLAAGMQKYEKIIADTLVSEYSPKTLILRNDEPIREKEGMELFNKIYYGNEIHKTIINENGIKMQVDVMQGQKTGYFLDQKANHRRIAPFVKGKRVLDCFTYTGAFAMNAAANGAKEVLAVDISSDSIKIAEENARLNGFHDIVFETANAFDILREMGKARRVFDVIILDPPAFTKSKAALAGAIRGYKEINLSAMKLLPAGGILATHSCSYHMPESVFIETVLSAAYDLKRQVRIIGLHRQDHDHPILGGYPESYYLKSLWLEMLE